jgi:hypothetical protein
MESEALPAPWDQYLVFQAKLDASRTIDGVSWGREAQLNRILAAKTPLSADEIERVGRSESRRERYRASLRRQHNEDAHIDGAALVHARHHLRLIKTIIDAHDWDLLTDVSAGVAYGDLAASTGAKAGALRVRVARIRQRIRLVAA